MAQQASPNVAGHIDCLRAQLTARSSVTSRMPRRTASSVSSAVLPVWSPPMRSTGTDDLRLGLGDVSRGLERRALRCGPVEPPAAPDVHVRHEDERDEDRHLDEPEQAEPAEADGPRGQEEDLDVEDDEQE